MAAATPESDKTPLSELRKPKVLDDWKAYIGEFTTGLKGRQDTYRRILTEARNNPKLTDAQVRALDPSICPLWPTLEPNVSAGVLGHLTPETLLEVRLVSRQVEAHTRKAPVPLWIDRYLTMVQIEALCMCYPSSRRVTLELLAKMCQQTWLYIAAHLPLDFEIRFLEAPDMALDKAARDLFESELPHPASGLVGQWHTNQALILSREAVRRDPKDAISTNNLAVILMERGLVHLRNNEVIEANNYFAEAELWLKESDNLQHHPTVYGRMGVLAEVNGRLDEALNYYTLAMEDCTEARPADEAAPAEEGSKRKKPIADHNREYIMWQYFRRASLLHKLGRVPESVVDFDEGVEVMPGDSLAYNVRAKFYTKLGLNKEAEADLAKAKQMRDEERAKNARQ
jgi:tetratricopeptide (TPR) repeat protein